jgi:peptidoglycan hydrolase CwlO-like protein
MDRKSIIILVVAVIVTAGASISGTLYFTAKPEKPIFETSGIAGNIVNVSNELNDVEKKVDTLLGALDELSPKFEEMRARTRRASVALKAPAEPKPKEEKKVEPVDEKDGPVVAAEPRG